MKIWEQTEWFQEIEKHKKIYIFGAGDAALATLDYIENCTVKKIDGFIVSDISKNPSSLAGYLVFQLNDKSLDLDAFVIMSTNMENNSVIKKLIKNAGFYDVIPSANQIVYGFCSEMPEYEDEKEFSKKPIIYIVTSHLNQHKVNVTFNIQCAKYIQAGAEHTDLKLCLIRDNEGEDNISSFNPYYCELTAGYWIWKNDLEHDYIGLFHYSRGLDLNDKNVNWIMKNDIDVVLPVPMKCSQAMASRLHRTDIELLMWALNEEDIIFFEEYLLGDSFLCGNIMFVKKEIYHDYYAWMMRILKKCECYYNNHDISVPKRLWGYYGEHLLNVYFRKKFFHIMYCKMKG